MRSGKAARRRRSTWPRPIPPTGAAGRRSWRPGKAGCRCSRPRAWRSAGSACRAPRAPRTSPAARRGSPRPGSGTRRASGWRGAAMAEAGRPTLMARDAGEAPAAVARMLERNRAAIAECVAQLGARPPGVVVTCARGSSDHAATYAKYLIETLAGVPVASAAPSVASLYRAPAAAGARLCLAISQSGQSPDLLASVAQQREAGAFTVVLVNAEDTPLERLAD